MDDETYVAICGTFTAQRFILENLYALILAQQPDPIAAAQHMGAEMLRQFEDIPSRTDPTAPADDAKWDFAITQHGVHHLERFWDGVEGRLRSRADRQA